MQKWNLFAIVFSHSTALPYFGKISEGNQDKLYAKVVLQVIVIDNNDENMPRKGSHNRYNFTIDFFFQLFPLQH